MASSPGPPCWVKLLLDVHHSRLAAERLRVDGYDVNAASDLPGLEALADDELLRQATAEGRAVVTENAKDFDRIVRSWVAAGERHAPNDAVLCPDSLAAGFVFPCLKIWILCDGQTKKTHARLIRHRETPW